MLSCFRKSNRNAKHHTTPRFCVNTNGYKYGTITYDVMHSHLSISGIKEEVSDGGGNGAISPFLKKSIELSRALAYVSGRDSVSSTYLIHYPGNFTSRDTLQIHLGNSEIERSINS